jgi:MFS family permease
MKYLEQIGSFLKKKNFWPLTRQYEEMFYQEFSNIPFFLYFSCTWLVNGDGLHPCKWDYNGQGIEYQIVAGPVFILIYTFAGIFISFAADKYNRKIMLASCLIFWSAMTLLTGFVNSYWQIVILRFGLGLG